MAMVFKRMFVPNDWGFRRQNWQQFLPQTTHRIQWVIHKYIKSYCFGRFVVWNWLLRSVIWIRFWIYSMII